MMQTRTVQSVAGTENTSRTAPSPGETLLAIFGTLYQHYGPQGWWPLRAGGAWEVMMGAVLTQHTSWTNVERALDNIEAEWGAEGLTSPEKLLSAPDSTLTRLLRPAGFYTTKPGKLQCLARFVISEGGVGALAASGESTASLREKLLGIRGIGPETADTILLYAFDRPLFIADAYALRLAARWGLLPPSAGYARIQALFMDHLPHDPELFGEFHALIVEHGKRTCRPRPRCDVCPLAHPIAVGDNAEWACPHPAQE